MKRVPLFQQPRGHVTVEEGATRGATIGVNIRDAAGNLWQPPPAIEARTERMPSTLWGRILEVPANVKALVGVSGTGLFVITGAGTGALRAITGSAGRIAVAAGDGVAGPPTIDLALLADAGTGAALVKITRDGYGRIAATAAASTDDLPEGATNLYYTAARARAAANSQILVTGAVGPVALATNDETDWLYT